MDDKDNRRTRKRLATRQSISDAATRLFMERGFDAVTIDDVAAVADVGRMTVFNHFPRKEDMFFDREEEIQALAFGAVRGRRPGVSPIEAVRILAHDLVTRDHEFMLLSDDTRRFIKTAMDSEALKARAREMRDDFTRALAIVLAETANQPTDDPNAHLAAGLIVSVWTVAFAEAQKLFDRTRNASEAKRCFITVIDRGITGTAAALAETAYV
ncbi:TetR/AcrR family transcriptional regulator [uncultured Bradyrhizobium sp.]|jgi:AcrR family transcriptional regulator|uniref:TetR/AcrR family transcriptional regulator n=1 Tax=uncultured Bradyrhizobium sp. TaxID=199684 RepID=UPI00261C3125|nr:TetR/AcrR family transcriptional regulator [uncultured Bradyrhizobium sp.]